MSDLQCPARFVLLGRDADADVLLDPADGSPLRRLEDLADLHRGQTLTVAVSEEARRRLPDHLRPDPGGRVVAEVDADGWRRLPEDAG